MRLNYHAIFLTIFSASVITGSTAAFGQTGASGPVIRAVIADSASRQVMPYVTIGVLDDKDAPLAAAYSKENGTFSIQLPGRGHFRLVVSSVGHRPLQLALNATQGAPSMADTLFLSTSSRQLGEVQVVARKQLIEQKPGMLVYNAGNDISNKGGTAADVLRKAPALNVDPQGNVSMRGSGTLRILVDGKYSGQMARSAADALNMMPADIIQSVEIITAPSAKYDAEGAAGVINIITKKGSKRFSGALEVAASNWEQAINPRISLSRDKWNMSFHGHFHRLQDKSAAFTERTSLENGAPTHILFQEKRQNNVMPHTSGELTIGFTPDSASELSLNVNAWLGSWPDGSRQTTRILLPRGELSDAYMQDARKKERFLGADISLGYTRKLKRPGQEFTAMAQVSPTGGNSSYNTLQSAADGKFRSREENASKTRNTEYTLQADYSHPLSADGAFMLESGLKSIFRDANNNYDVWFTDTPPPAELVFLSDRSDKFSYSQTVVAGYVLMKMKFKRGWYAEAGARLEHTDMEGKFRGGKDAFSNTLLNFVPTATLSKKLDDIQSLSLSYTKRLTRPYIWDLNPNADASDPSNIVVGNPSLLPEIMHQGELSYSLTPSSGMFLNLAAFYKQTDQSIFDLTTTGANGIATTQKQNLAGNRQYGLNLSSSFQLTSKWNMNGNLNVNRLDYESRALFVASKGWATDVNVNTMYKLPGAVTLSAFGEYSTRKITFQGHTTPWFFYSFSAKKEIPDAKMTITLSAINPFNNTLSQTEIINTPTFRSSVLNWYYDRSLKLTLNWEFGSMFEQKARKKISNDDVRDKGGE
ncbi:TonB-dependent receptor [Chitinophaga sp.]|mgnify:CR=1 FL=1|uniref:TonB-dependent receptor domain-containing protein n=1 Tax=Chitinophaga sp. TaxID=1869181 RepID=UPI0026399FE2|nr:TonB-dependent receptor [uncultured Chitinophaga sp.]